MLWTILIELDGTEEDVAETFDDVTSVVAERFPQASISLDRHPVAALVMPSDADGSDVSTGHPG